MNGLYNLESLIWLDARDNHIEDTKALEHLIGLEKLFRWNNHISSLSFLSDLKGLKWLEFGGNRLTTINLLMELHELKMVFVNDNLIDFSENSKELSVVNQLISNGVEVNFEPQQNFNYFKKID